MMMRRNRRIVSIVHPTILLLIVPVVVCFLLYNIVPVVVVVRVVPVQATEIKWIPNNNDGKQQETKKDGTSRSSINAENAPKSQKYWNDNNIQRPDYGKTDSEIAFERRQMGSNTLPKWLLGFIISAVFGILAAKYLLDQQNTITNISNFISSSSSSSLGNNNTTSNNNDEKMRLARLAKFTTDANTTTTAINNSITKID